jgi:transcriptional regulator of arginine metabolism
MRRRSAGARNEIRAKPSRQHAILRTIARQRVRTQQDLVEALRRAGFDATQATVSRDVVELGLVKVRGTDGTRHYASPRSDPGVQAPERLRRFCEDYPVDGAVGTSMVVLRSAPGSANALAAAIDACALPQVVGTLAGDDTVIVATQSAKASRQVLVALRDFGVAGRTG